MNKAIENINLNTLSMADKATVYFFYHQDPEAQKEAFNKCQDPQVMAVMTDALPHSEDDVYRLGGMDKETRKEWLISRLSSRALVESLITDSDNAKLFRDSIKNNVSVLPVKPKRKEIIPDEVFKQPKPRFPHVRESESGRITILNTSDNLSELLAHYGYSVRTNQMTLEFELFHYGQKVTNKIEESRSLIVSLASLAGLTKTAIDDHLPALAGREMYHPVKHLLDVSGKWDGKERVNAVIACLNAKHPELANSVIRKWLVGCVASLYEKRFKSKLVPILHGDQSYRKTAFVERVASLLENSFLEGAELDPDKKDSVIASLKSWVVELGEMERTSKKGQGALKAFITKEVDTVRLPYGRADIKKPRQTHFIGTVNDDSFLRDETGSSRYAVIEMLQAVNTEALNSLLGWQWKGTGSYHLDDERQLIQFWLEVKALYNNGHAWHLNQDDIAQLAEINEKFSFKDSYYQAIEDTFLTHTEADNYRMEWLTSSNVCALLELTKDKARPVGRALKRLVSENRVNAKISRGVTYYELPRMDTSN